MTYYDPNATGEAQRLKTQYLLAGTRDADLIMDAFPSAGRDRVSVLDVGCASGLVTKRVFARMPFVSNVIGVDRDEQSIERFNSQVDDARFVGAVLDVEAADAEEQLRRILLENWAGDGIDIAYASLALHHMRNPVRVLGLVHSVMRDGGLMFARSTDDGAKIAYPDDDGIVEELIRRTAALPNASDRFHGRKMPSQFAQAGFTDIRVVNSSLTTEGMGADERHRLFQSAFSWRRTLFERRAGMASWDAVADAMDDYRWACEALDELERRFADPSFFFSLDIEICMGRKL